ncbi:hypothetical protein MKZ38_010175 [Zalerion maritima]|uniref:Peptide hydrolase n=1 Tax=Zalerion maritima TaxID=339359 RepID=A0AAD5RG72_9PEZI|nr:hypothetical protein MKZ38_010175 [Zalerion maritima]
MKVSNPFAFRPAPVTFWIVLVYAAILIPLIIVHETVPLAESPRADLDEAWNDLKTLTQAYHPYNSRYNDEVRSWLLQRIKEILDHNGAAWSKETLGRTLAELPTSIGEWSPGADVVVFDDLVANFTSTISYGILGKRPGEKAPPGMGTYFEGTNIYVYIRGKQDKDGDWWTQDVEHADKLSGGGVLINAHYDSVSTGFGATDDGMGVVTVLQLIKHFSKEGNQPEHGIVALLNNGEEDFLWGSRAFGQSPIMPFIHTFLNLEGAGAGGRALLFRTSDQEVTKAYKGVKHPFGSVLMSDSFELGMIRSQTDFVVLNGIFGERGLDMAFYRPRARYHTNQDDVIHTTKASLSTMLESSRKVMTSLSGDTGNTFSGRRSDGKSDLAQNGSPTSGVWFDLFGSSFSVFGLKTLFAWSLTLLIASPIILMILTVILVKCDKYYFLISSVNSTDEWDAEPISIGGLKGLFRFPLAFVVSGALVVGGAFLVKKINPLIVYSSEYSVWAMFFSLFFVVFWFIMRGAAFVRPTALHRGYAMIWLFTLSWCFLVTVTVFEDRFHIAGLYAFVWLHAVHFFALFISLCELFALPKIHTYAQDTREDREETVASLTAGPRPESLISPSPGEAPSSAGGAAGDDDEEETVAPTEITPLVSKTTSDPERTTFATGYRRSVASISSESPEAKKSPSAEADEQPWSTNLPCWTWILQFLILGPFTVMLMGQIGLVISAAVSQTGSDGSSLLFPYMTIEGFCVVMLLPLSPFVHRMSYHVPTFLSLVFLGTLIYNLAAFPFSEANRYKTFFQQTLDIATGDTTVKFAGLEEYVKMIIDELPAARGKGVTCEESSRWGLVSCEFDGSDVPPRLAATTGPSSYEDLIKFNVTRDPTENKAKLEINAANTKACFVKFETPVSAFSVEGSTWDSRFGAWPESGLQVLKLWRRDWETSWKVDLEWSMPEDDEWVFVASPGEGELAAGGGYGSEELKQRDENGDVGDEEATMLNGRIVCIWSDANDKGTIPALDEALQFAPSWAAITKMAEGLVEGSVGFSV